MELAELLDMYDTSLAEGALQNYHRPSKTAVVCCSNHLLTYLVPPAFPLV